MFLYHLYLMKEIRQIMELTPNSKVLYKLLLIFNRGILYIVKLRGCFIPQVYHFVLARIPYYRGAFSYAANTYNLSRYVLPTYNKLRGPILSKERSQVENLLQPIRNSWNHKGVTIVNDGWSDPQKIPLINFMTITESGLMF